MLAHVCQKYMRFQANVRERVVLAPKSRAIIKGTIVTRSDVQCCPTSVYHDVDPKPGIVLRLLCINKQKVGDDAIEGWKMLKNVIPVLQLH